MSNDTELLTSGPPLVPTELVVGDDVLDSGGTMQQVRTSYMTAVQVQQPRNIEEVGKRLMREAQHAGETFYYGWATKGKKKGRIEGPSVGLTVAAARCWGNCAVEAQPVQDGGDAWIFTAAFIDLETGFTIGRQFRQSKRTTVYGDMDAERKDDIRFQIGQSKATRNVIRNALPKWLIDRAMEEAKRGVRKKIAAYVETNGIGAAITYILRDLAKYGVTEEQVLAKCLVAESKAITVDHIVVLKGDIMALHNGEERVEVLFPVAGEPRTEALQPETAAPSPAETEPASKPQEEAAEQAQAVEEYGGEIDRAADGPKPITAIHACVNQAHADPGVLGPAGETIAAYGEKVLARIKGKRGEQSNQTQQELLPG